jgi:tRNA G18 (ribose-2'-O)-methylase SpoU
MPIRVEDPLDPRLADYRELKDPARSVRETARSIFVVEGRLAVARLLASPYTVQSLLVDEHQASAASGVVASVEATGAPVYVTSREALETTVGFALHRGVVAVARRPAPADPAEVVAGAVASARAGGSRAVLVVLEGLNDHENLGALFRNAAAFGVSAVLIDPSCADPLYRRSVRVSLGHVLTVPFARVASWPAGLTELVSGCGFVVTALAPEHSARVGGLAAEPLTLATWAAQRASAPAIALLLGAEGPGLSPAALGAADEVVSIPMAGGVDSLNVATAGALAFYELGTRWARQPAP